MNRATEICISRTNPRIEVGHWLVALLDSGEKTDFSKILSFWNLNEAKVRSDLESALLALPTGASSVSGLGPMLISAMEQAWLCSSLNFEKEIVRTGHVILAMLEDPSLGILLQGLSVEFKKIQKEVLRVRFDEITDRSCEAGGVAAPEGSSGEVDSDSAIQKYTCNLTEMAERSEIDPVFCRELEIRKAIDILLRRRQNNPIFVGEPGVGKTAVVEGLAIMIAQGKVPPALRNVRLHSLDLGLLQAGASMRGEFEKRLKLLIKEVEESPNKIILFIDEAHNLIGAGGGEGVGDAANLLKPALARGALRMIAATTWREYKKYFETDPALTRRFQIVSIEEPSEDDAIHMTRGTAEVLSRHHGVTILDEAVCAAVRLSKRYLPTRQLPDKAVSLLDTAAARTALTMHAEPSNVSLLVEKISLNERRLDFLKREAVTNDGLSQEIEALELELGILGGDLEKLREKYERERCVVGEMMALKERLFDASEDDAERGRLREAFIRRDAEIQQAESDEPMIFREVSAAVVAKILAEWTGIPVGKMLKDEVESLLHLAESLCLRVRGQDEGLRIIAQQVMGARAGIGDPDKPIGVFLLVGPSGVGKTETALALADAIYGGEQNLITFNMTEFQESHTASTLKGAPPGYVGYGEGGALTEAVRKRPYSVILLDEIEKAHPDIHQLFFQVFDKGFMEDGEGRFVDFTNTIILLTSNEGSDLISDLCSDPELLPSAEKLAEAIRPALLRKFPAAFLGRLAVVPYFPLSADILAEVVDIQLRRFSKRLFESRNVAINFDESVPVYILGKGSDSVTGVRMLKNVIERELSPLVARELLRSVIEERGEIESLSIRVDAGEGCLVVE